MRASYRVSCVPHRASCLSTPQQVVAMTICNWASVKASIDLGLLMCEARAADLRHAMADQNNSLAPSSKTEAAGRR